MAVNRDKGDLWKSDIAQSVDFYNNWFLDFAPKAYREKRGETTALVESALKSTANLTNIGPSVLQQDPAALLILRMATAPPIARDRLIGLGKVSPTLVKSMEGKEGVSSRIPPKMSKTKVEADLIKIGILIKRLADTYIFTWLEDGHEPTEAEIHRAATIVADRLCGAKTDPIIRNAQERRQLAAIKDWLEKRGYSYASSGVGLRFRAMDPGSFVFRLNIRVSTGDEVEEVTALAEDAALEQKADFDNLAVEAVPPQLTVVMRRPPWRDPWRGDAAPN